MTTGVLEGNVTGLIGIAFPSLASTNATPWLLAVANSGQLTEPMISFLITRQQISDASETTLSPGGSVTLGGTNSTFFSGPLDYVPILQPTLKPSYWLVPVESKCSVGARCSLTFVSSHCQ